MIVKADKNTKGQSESNNPVWRIVGEHVIRGDAGTVTSSLHDIVEIPLEIIPDEEQDGPTIEQVREFLNG